MAAARGAAGQARVKARHGEFSIVLVAAEIVRLHRGEPSLTARQPWLVAFCFGLLHGFGFAGALSQIGLPQGELPLALLAFNVGVELGQLAFIAAVLAVVALVRRLRFAEGLARQARAPRALCHRLAGGVLVRRAGCRFRGGVNQSSA